MKVPSYLGPSFAFIGPVLAVTDGDASKVPFALCGIAGAAVLYAAAALVSIYLRDFIRLLPILMGVIVGHALSAFFGVLDPHAVDHIRTAAWIGLPPFRTPAFSLNASLVVASVSIVLVAENKGPLAAISGYMDRDLNSQLGRAYPGGALATFVSAMGGRIPQTTYAESMGVMAITRVFSTYDFTMAAAIGILLGLRPKFGAIIQSIPNPVLGGITLILYGLIALMGLRIWIDAGVDFSDHKNLLIAGASLIATTGLRIRDLTVAGVNIAGIAFGTVLALVLNLRLSLELQPKTNRHPSESAVLAQLPLHHWQVGSVFGRVSMHAAMQLPRFQS